MESLLNRYRNITVLLLVILAQLVLLAVSAKNDQDVRMIRIWTATAGTPGGGVMDLRRRENTFFKNELSTADRAKALQLFQEHTQSKMLAAKIIGMGAG